EGKGVDVAPVIDLRGWLQAELVSPTAPVAPASPSAAAKPQPPKKAPAGVATKTSAPVAVPAAAGSQPAVADQQQLPAQAQRRPQGDGIGSNVPVSLWKDPKDAPFSPKAAGAQPLPSLVQPAATAPATPSATPAAVRQEPSGN
ncbi:MAG TPA: hypothetical protein DCL54_17750, partial [Alphaproteobacteria bacterium]|nr:hypothetical protein [Alphaproteobacteria bacterium]